MTYRNREKIPRRSPKRTPHPWVKFGLRVGRNPVAARVQAEAVEREDARIARMQAAGTLAVRVAPFSMTVVTQPISPSSPAIQSVVAHRRNERMASRRAKESVA